jgi:uncharacterized protein
MNLQPLLQEILRDYALLLGGAHGVAHWARVLENGLRLADETDANRNVVRLFAVLHDSCRINECWDPDHGPRAAVLARKFRGDYFELMDHDFKLLCRACEGHTHEVTHPNITIQTCWDADRLDLGRVGIEPHPRFLGTPPARRREVLDWAHGRATFRVIPDLVPKEWGIQLD